jgi:transposase
LSAAPRWTILVPLIPASQPGGRPPKWTRRQILDDIFSVVRSGCQWALLPCEFPLCTTDYHSFRLWRLDGTWERLHTTSREQERVWQSRSRQASACTVDSQSAKTTGVGGIRGYNGSKKLVGRKRHVAAGTRWVMLELVLTVTVHPADI